MYLNTNKTKYQIIPAKSFLKRLFDLWVKEILIMESFFPNVIPSIPFYEENIDIIGLDENKEVIYKYENLPKNKIIKINNERKNTSILEMTPK